MVATAVLLDSGPLGLVTNPKPSPQNRACSDWLQSLLEAGVTVFIPEIADYEVRRELVRANKTRGLLALDMLSTKLNYLRLCTGVMRDAAELWARARNSGNQTTDDRALDGDVILAAQARSLGLPQLVVATTNVAHLARFVPSEHWIHITATQSPTSKPR